MKTLMCALVLLLSTSVFATDDSVAIDPFQDENKESFYFLPLPPSQAYSRAQAVFNYFKVPTEVSNEDSIRVFQSATSLAEMKQILDVIDTTIQFGRFVRVSTDSMDVFQDRDGYTKKDFHFEFSPTKDSTYIPDAIANITNARNNSEEEPLRGLRIALDPGHMSTRDWELRTGKYVKNRSGIIISEGLIVLQTALLLKTEFEKLGATVTLTREDHQPVSKVTLSSLDLKEFGRLALRERSLEDWFQSLLTVAAPGPALYSAFEKSSKVQALFKESARENYFIVREDLKARVNAIDEAKPDISLVLHYDTIDPPGNPNGVGTSPYSKVKTYIHGALSAQEWATQDDRLHVLKHALDPETYKASLGLAKSVVNNLSSTLGLVHDVSGGGNSKLIAPGVFVRNLYISRKMHGHAHAYVECLHYNDPKEFKALQQKDFQVAIAGQTTYYSKRLQQVVFGIRDGVVKFVRGQ